MQSTKRDEEKGKLKRIQFCKDSNPVGAAPPAPAPADRTG